MNIDLGSQKRLRNWESLEDKDKGRSEDQTKGDSLKKNQFLTALLGHIGAWRPYWSMEAILEDGGHASHGYCSSYTGGPL